MKTLSSSGYDTDKSDGYLKIYQRFFSLLKDKPVKLLELGIFNGGSLMMWRDYFEKGIIVGLDRNQIELDDLTGRIQIYQGEQQDTNVLDTIALKSAPEGFDIIIDDASHIGELTRISFWHLFKNHLKNGGIYAIEDWGTGYWETFPDGKKYTGENHCAGLVGFIKDIVDECGMADITKAGLGISPFRESLIEKMQISHGQIIIVKK